MKKRLLALVLVVAMAACAMVACGSEEATEEVKEEVTFDVEAEFEPNADYAKYTLIEYTIEAIDATFVATVSANEELSEFEIHCAFYGDEQLAVLEYDGSEYTVVSDKTGFMQGDAPALLDACLEQDKWATIE